MELSIEAKQISKRAPSGTFLLQSISLQVYKGEIFGIIGPSGAGKSSLLKCLCSLDLDFSGDVILCGETLSLQRTGDLRRVRKQLGLISQQYHLITGKTVEQNVALPLLLDDNQDRTSVDELLERVGLSHKKHAYPASLSGGEKQRVAIARALVRKPSILFCDEITSALDPQRAEEILLLLQQLNKDLGVTLVIVSHELRSVRKICHRIAVLDQGRIIEQGTSLQLFSKPEHPTTRELLTAVHGEADISLFQETGRSLLFLRLHFTGTGTKQPLLSTLISSLQVEVNIVCGWIDVVENTPIGSLTVALCATRRQDVVDFCTKHQVHCEFL